MPFEIIIVQKDTLTKDYNKQYVTKSALSLNISYLHPVFLSVFLLSHSIFFLKI